MLPTFNSEQLTLERSTIAITDLNSQGDEKDYWLSVTPCKRLEALEIMRQINYGYNPTTARQQKEFLRLLNSKKVDYLLIGGYAVSYYGYPRATGDMDIWIGINPENAPKIVEVLEKFGFGVPALQVDLFLQKNKWIITLIAFSKNVLAYPLLRFLSKG